MYVIYVNYRSYKNLSSEKILSDNTPSVIMLNNITKGARLSMETVKKCLLIFLCVMLLLVNLSSGQAHAMTRVKEASYRLIKVEYIVRDGDTAPIHIEEFLK